MAYLVIHTAHPIPQRMKLGVSTVIGRSMGNELWIDDRRLSRKHCRIEQRGEQFVLTDLDSTNGTYIHGQSLAEEHVLIEGDTFQAGDARIVFHEGELKHRPADPWEAISHGTGSLLPNPELESSTLVGYSMPHPNPQPQKIDEAARSKAVSLAFKRPPPRPIVKEQSPDDPGESKWFPAIFSRRRGR